MNNFINRNIVIAKLETKVANTGNTKYIITDKNNDKYYFWQISKGADSSVYESYKGMKLKPGEMVYVSFTEEDKEWTNPEGKLIKFTERFVSVLREASGTPEEKPHQGAVNAPQSKPEIDWDKLGYKKTLTNWTSELLGQGSPVEEIKKFLQGEAWELWKAIDVEGERRFNPARVAFEQKTKEQAEIQKQIENVPPENVPLPEDPGEVDVDSIPF